jgi:hypothetical protein
MPKNAMLRVARVNGVPRISVQGELLPLFIYRNRLHTDYNYIKRFVQDGHRIIVCSILQDPEEPWTKFKERTENHLNRLLDLGHKHYLIFGNYFVVSREWAKKNPDHVCHGPDGKILDWTPQPGRARQEGIRYALSSPLVREEMRKYTQAHVEILEGLQRKNRVIGMMFEGGGAQEWYVYQNDPRWVFSEAAPCYLVEFREFLRRTYVKQSALREAWRDRRVTFETAQPAPDQKRPEPDIGDFYDPAGHQRYIDTRAFLLEFHTAAVLAGPREMKKHRPDLLAGFFNEPIADDSFSLEGDLRVRSDPAIDFFAGPPPYECRAPKDAQPLHTLTGSLRMRNKIFIAEEDQSPPHNKQGNWKGGVRDMNDYCAMLLRQGVQDITHSNYAWWWDFQFQQHQTKQEHDTFAALLRLDAWNLRHGGAPNAQIAVVWERDGAPYMRGNGRVSRNLGHREMIQELNRIGAPFDGYAVDDLTHPDFPRKQYKLYVVPFVTAPNAAARKALEGLKRDGVTILWGWGAGFCFPGKARGLSVAHMEALTGFQFRVHDQRLAPAVFVADGEHPLQLALPDSYAYGQFTRELRSAAGSPESPLFPPLTACAPLFAVDDPAATVLGYTATEDAPPFSEAGNKKADAFAHYGVELHPGLAIKTFKKWTSVYSGTVMLPARLIREVARLAGVHIYSDTPDLFFANSRMIGYWCSYRPGLRAVHLPRPSTVVDLLDPKERVLARNASEIVFDAELYRLRVFGLR